MDVSIWMYQWMRRLSDDIAFLEDHVLKFFTWATGNPWNCRCFPDKLWHPRELQTWRQHKETSVLKNSRAKQNGRHGSLIQKTSKERTQAACSGYLHLQDSAHISIGTECNPTNIIAGLTGERMWAPQLCSSVEQMSGIGVLSLGEYWGSSMNLTNLLGGSWCHQRKLFVKVAG